MSNMSKKKRVMQLRQSLMDACCPGCGQALVRRGEVEPLPRTPAQDAIIWPIAVALAKRASTPPQHCSKCGRPIERYDWGWLLQYATDIELAAIERALRL
jgi:predicted RNA-binding Zn-ribbon protein involved in translation (DUF1610 family)